MKGTVKYNNMIPIYIWHIPLFIDEWNIAINFKILFGNIYETRL